MTPKDGSSTPPLWTEEFSVHGADDAYVLRRQFTKFLVLTSFGMTAGNGWILARSLMETATTDYPRLVIARASDVTAGSVKMFSYPTANDPCLLVRRIDGEFAAFSQKCTHLSCAVYYSSAHDRLECPCHEGYFSAADGRVLQGPPPRPLPRVRLEQHGEEIIAVGLDLDGSGK